MDLIRHTYTDPASEAGFAGANQLYKVVHALNRKITRKDVHQFLEETPAYTKHRPRYIHYKRLKTVPSGYFTDFQVCK